MNTEKDFFPFRVFSWEDVDGAAGETLSANVASQDK